MRHLRPAPFAFLALLLLGCSAGQGRPDAGDAGGAVDDLTITPTFDVPSDLALRDTPDVGDVVLTCAVNLDCPRGMRCLQGRCTEDVCLASETPCGNDRCEMRCVPIRDLCAGVVCAAGQTCFSGRCVAGCFPSPCAGVTCPAGQFCNDGTGTCARITPCPGLCNDGFTCHIGCLPRTPCDNVMCASNQICANGRCVTNQCAGVSCAAGSICTEGRCVDTCACATPCDRSPRDRCLVGQCTCERTCTADTPCGTDDGCGGRCAGPCANPRATCDPVLFSCDCVPRCDAADACGQDDGCGGHCTEGCGAGERCDPALGRCICIQRCPDPSVFASTFCGVPVRNVCPDGPVCGAGTMCPPGQRCNPDLQRCECDGDACPPPEGDAVVPGGGPGGDGSRECPMGLSACMGNCYDTQTDRHHCGDCAGNCPDATTCVAGRCTCPTGLTLCGARCVDVATESGNCGGCGTVCGSGLACHGGRCECSTACVVDLNVIACGTEVPSPCPGGPSCGFGRQCPVGQSCDVRTRRCVCVPNCPASGRCGNADGCGGQCVGVCNTGETCTQDSTDPRHFFCSAAGCAAGCRCDEICAMNHCVQVTCSGGDRPCPCACCPFGQMCVGGSTCVIIPP